MKKFTDLFREKYYARLNSLPHYRRGDGFLRMFELLEAKQKSRYQIVETGTSRPGPPIESDGHSTLLFDEFVNCYDGSVLSVDINPVHCQYSQAATSPKTTVICSDSVRCLWTLAQNYLQKVTTGASFDIPDLIYLDSYDVTFDNPHLSNMHHIKELVCVAPFLVPGTILAVDDCQFLPGDPRIPPGIAPESVGKGTYVRDFMANVGARLIHDGYQLVWQL